MAGKKHDEGVSVIVGTLLLILITVTAAAGLAVMISQMQKDAIDRQSKITAAQNEQIQITGVAFRLSPADWDQYSQNATLNQSYAISNQSYSSVTFTLSNLNNEEARVIGISVNGIYAHNVTVIPDPSLSLPIIPYNLSNQEPSSYIPVPASAGLKVRVNFTGDFFTVPSNIGQNDQITIHLMTSLFNSFVRTFQPPNPVVQFSTDSQNIGSIQRDVLVLDGSSSFAANNNSITDWSWSVLDAANTTTTEDLQANCTDSVNLSQAYSGRGKIIHYQPRSQGPFCVNLTVQDNTGMKKTSDYVIIPENDQFVPPMKPRVQFNQPFINVTILDINGNPVPDQVVNYIIDNNPSGNLTLSYYVGETNNSGMNSTMVLGDGNTGGGGTGTVNVVYGDFQPYPVMVSNITP